MAKRYTKEKKYIALPEEAINKIESMVETWTYDTKAFVRSRLNQYTPPHPHGFFGEKFFLFCFFYEKKTKADECP